MTTTTVVPSSPIRCRTLRRANTNSSSVCKMVSSMGVVVVALMLVAVVNTATAFQSFSTSSSSSLFTSQRQSSLLPQQERPSTSQRIDEDVKLSSRLNINNHDMTKRRRRRCSLCCESNNNNNQNDLDLDRREATFAMLGTLWAVTGGVISTTALFPTAAAHAAYGTEAKIQLPNPLENIILRSEQGCLVESLGNRECLVYGSINSNNSKIYQGANGAVLVQRLQQAIVALSSIPDLATSKKWSAIQGVLTGPMGTLIATMNQLLQVQRETTSTSTSTASSPKERVAAAEQLAAKVKQDIFAISAAADRKQSDQVLKSQQQATSDLIAFLKALE